MLGLKPSSVKELHTQPRGALTPREVPNTDKAPAEQSLHSYYDCLNYHFTIITPASSKMQPSVTGRERHYRPASFTVFISS